MCICACACNVHVRVYLFGFKRSKLVVVEASYRSGSVW